MAKYIELLDSCNTYPIGSFVKDIKKDIYANSYSIIQKKRLNKRYTRNLGEKNHTITLIFKSIVIENIIR